MRSRKFLGGLLACVLIGAPAAAEAEHHQRDHHDKTAGTVLGIGLGLLGGALLSDGDPWATLAGAAAGGAIGNAASDGRDRHRRGDSWRDHHRGDDPWRDRHDDGRDWRDRR